MHSVVPSFNIQHSPVHDVDNTDDELKTAQKLTQHNELAAHPIKCEEKPQLNTSRSDRAEPDLGSKFTVHDTPRIPPPTTRAESVKECASNRQRTAPNWNGLGVLISTVQPSIHEGKIRLKEELQTGTAMFRISEN